MDLPESLKQCISVQLIHSHKLSSPSYLFVRVGSLHVRHLLEDETKHIGSHVEGGAAF